MGTGGPIYRKWSRCWGLGVGPWTLTLGLIWKVDSVCRGQPVTGLDADWMAGGMMLCRCFLLILR